MYRDGLYHLLPTNSVELGGYRASGDWGTIAVAIWRWGCKATASMYWNVGGKLEEHYSGVDQRGPLLTFCIPLAIPPPRDVKDMVIFDMDSSNVLFDCLNKSIIYFITRGSSLVVFINSWSCCDWDSAFSISLLLLSTNLGMLERYLYFFTDLGKVLGFLQIGFHWRNQVTLQLTYLLAFHYLFLSWCLFLMYLHQFQRKLGCGSWPATTYFRQGLEIFLNNFSHYHFLFPCSLLCGNIVSRFKPFLSLYRTLS